MGAASEASGVGTDSRASVSTSDTAYEQHGSVAEMAPPQCSSSSPAGGVAFSGFVDLNARLKKAYMAMAPRFDGYRESIEDFETTNILMEEPFPPAPVELCRMPVAGLRSFSPSSVRDVLRPIGLALAANFGFQVGQEHDNGKTVHSNLDNQIEHLVCLLKWRMDRTTEEDPREALWRATDDLHQKTLENYRRWVKYVNLQEGNVRGGSVDDSDVGSENWISLSALSGNAWEFFGMCGFTSDMNESSWVCNAQLHHLLLWYLIWGEASNLRFTPELLCFLFYCMSNALMLSTQSDSEVAILADETNHLDISQENGFLNSIVMPIYKLLEHEVLSESVSIFAFETLSGKPCARRRM
ncbi:MAG: hypothetical protein SGPRY_000533 [Prymnesium sp.]